MAYRIDRRIAVLAFEDGELDGIEVRCRLDIKLKALFDIQSAADSGDILGAMVMFAEQALVSWNIEDEDGSEIPATVDGMHTLPIGVCSKILTAWVKAVSTTPLV